MFHLETDQEFFTPNGYRVCNTGDYNPEDLVEVYRENDLAKLSCVAFQANFIATGLCVVDSTIEE